MRRVVVLAEAAEDLLVLLEETVKPQLGGGPHSGFETLTNALALCFDSGILIAVADVLQQVRHLCCK
jgi:hypothetical protein